MGLSKYKISKLISVCDERNSYGYTNFYGLNINKEFMPTWANTEGLDESKYKVVRKKRFVFSGMQTGRDECIRISMYDGEEPIIVSPAYTTFEVIREDLVIPEYFFMLFLSKEKDRFGGFCSDGSIRSNLDWERFVDFDISLPSIEQQRKYVDVYLALQNNLAAYQSKVEELKLVCDGYLDKLKSENEKLKIGEFIEQYDGEEPLLVSSIYTTFKSKDTSKLLPEYLFMFFNRPEFDRYARFNSWGSAREVFTMDDMNDVAIPIPDISVQREIVNIHKCYIERQRIVEALKEQLKKICPVLIRGSLMETSN